MKKHLFLILLSASFLAHGQTTATLTRLRAYTTKPSTTTVYKIGSDLYKYDPASSAFADDGFNIIKNQKGYAYRRLTFVDILLTPPKPTYKNAEQSYTATCSEGYTGQITKRIAAGVVSSAISQKEADSIAYASAMAQAKAALFCTPNAPPVADNTEVHDEGFGDSITEGIGVTDRTKTWFYIFSGGTGANNGVSGSTVYLQGVTGKNFINTSQFKHYTGGYATIMYGTNSDGNNGSAEWKAKYQSIVQGFIDAGYPKDHVILCSPPYNKLFGDGLLPIRDAVKEVAQNLGVLFADVTTYTKGFDLNLLYNPNDIIHPNEYGNKIIGEYLKTFKHGNGVFDPVKPVDNTPVPVTDEPTPTAVQDTSAKNRDAEVTLTGPGEFTAFFRNNGQEAYYFYYNGNTLNIGIAVGNPSGVVPFQWKPEQRRFLYNGGIGAANNVTFGVSGFDLYVKKDGVEVIRFQDHHIRTAGTTSFRGNAQRFTFTALQPKPLYSTTSTIDVRDFGFREGRTTGSIQKGSNQIILNEQPKDGSYKVGDVLNIGTANKYGVGGVWPALSFADESSMRNSMQKVNTLAYLENTKGTYQRNDTGWVKFGFGLSNYPNPFIYTRNLIGLQARITAVNGNTITLNTTAKATAQNVPVAYDNSFILNKLTTSEHYNYPYTFTTEPGKTDLVAFDANPKGYGIKIPSGKYNVGETVLVQDRTNITITGAGKDSTLLYSLPGMSGGEIKVMSSPNTVIENLTLDGGTTDSTTPFYWHSYALKNLAPTQTDFVDGGAYKHGISFEGACQNSIGRNLRVMNTAAYALLGTSNNVWFLDCDIIENYETSFYLGWWLQLRDCVGGGAKRINIYSKKMSAAMEMFKVNGGTFEDIYIRNGISALNNVGNSLFKKHHRGH